MKKVAVVLSGCGHTEGSEVTEAVSALIAIGLHGGTSVCFAPNDVLAESNRIARGTARKLSELKEKDFDAVVFPGGFGAAKVLSTWAAHGANSTVDADVVRVITEFHQASKPIGAICIAPTLVAKVLGHEGVTVTVGNDEETAREISKTGAHPVRCAVDDYVSDRDHKVMTTPAYMYDARPQEVFRGIEKMITELLEMA